MILNKQEIINEILEFRFSLNNKDINFIDARNENFISFIKNEYQKLNEEELQEELDFYVNLIHCN